MIDIDETAEAAIKKYGKDAQIVKSLEELGELVTAICQNYNGRPVGHVLDEIADVFIMIRQLRIIYGADLVDQKIQFKLGRLLSRMKNNT